jgi:hypothetical protein
MEKRLTIRFGGLTLPAGAISVRYINSLFLKCQEAARDEIPSYWDSLDDTVGSEVI